MVKLDNLNPPGVDLCCPSLIVTFWVGKLFLLYSSSSTKNIFEKYFDVLKISLQSAIELQNAYIHCLKVDVNFYAIQLPFLQKKNMKEKNNKMYLIL